MNDVLIMAASAAIILSFTYTLGMYLEGRVVAASPTTAARDLLFVFVIPCLNEERVIGSTLQRLESATTSGAVVVVVDDGSDDRTADVVRTSGNEQVLLLQRRLPEARQGKGAALNAAMKFLDGHRVLEGWASEEVVICLLDADGRLDAHAPEVARELFADPTVGGVQVAVRIGNRASGLLPRLQDMEFVCYTELFQRCRSKLGFAGLGGNGQFTRLSAMRSLGSRPWAPTTLTEDLDLGVRLVLQGWRIVYSSEASVSQQGLQEVSTLVRQRSRWFQGLLQCWRLIPRVARETTGRARFDLLHMLLSPALFLAAFLMTASFIISPVEVLAREGDQLQFLSPNIILAWYLLTFLPATLFALVYRRVSSSGWMRAIALGHVFVLYGLLWVAAGFRAAWRMVAGRQSWLKTERLLEARPAALTPLAAASSATSTAPPSADGEWHWNLPSGPEAPALGSKSAVGARAGRGHPTHPSAERGRGSIDVEDRPQKSDRPKGRGKFHNRGNLEWEWDLPTAQHDR